MTMKTANRLEGIGEYYFSQKLREIEQLNRQGRNIINLGIGSPDQPPHPDVIRALQDESAKPNVHAYQGYKGIPALRQAMAAWYKTWYGVELDPEAHVLPLAGSKEGIMHICMTYVNPGDIVLVPDPGYPTYRSAATLAGARVLSYSLTEASGWAPDLAQIAALLEEKPATQSSVLMFVNYPHMPTGQLPGEGLFGEIVQFARGKDVLLVHDNPYSFILNDRPASLLSVPGALDCAIELNSLSKSHNMAGWRVGMLLASPDRVQEVLRFKSNMDSGMFMPLQVAAARALALPRSWYDQVNALYAARRGAAYGLLDAIGCAYSKNQAGMFLWAHIPDRYPDAYKLSDDLLYNASVFLTPGGIFGAAGEKYIRISLCSPEEKIRESLARIEKNLQHV